MWFIILHCITDQNFKRIWLHLVGYGQKNIQKQRKIWNLKDIWKLGNCISNIKWNLYIWYTLKYVLTQHLLFTKSEAVNQGTGRKERGHPKILRVSLKFERSFGDLLHINPQTMWPNWYGNLLIITSPSTSSYSFSLPFSGHWHTKSLLPSQKPSKTGSVNSIFGNIEIKKRIFKNG